MDDYKLTDRFLTTIYFCHDLKKKIHAKKGIISCLSAGLHPALK